MYINKSINVNIIKNALNMLTSDGWVLYFAGLHREERRTYSD